MRMMRCMISMERCCVEKGNSSILSCRFSIHRPGLIFYEREPGHGRVLCLICGPALALIDTYTRPA